MLTIFTLDIIYILNSKFPDWKTLFNSLSKDCGFLLILARYINFLFNYSIITQLFMRINRYVLTVDIFDDTEYHWKAFNQILYNQIDNGLF